MRNHWNEETCEHGLGMPTGCNPCQRRSGHFDKDGVPVIRDHGFVPVRSNPSICNDCGQEKPAHLHKRQQ